MLLDNLDLTFSVWHTKLPKMAIFGQTSGAVVFQKRGKQDFAGIVLHVV